MGKKTRVLRAQTRRDLRHGIPEPAFPARPVVTVDIEALDDEINRRGLEQARKESAASIARISARFRR